jgi:hypothetical protein
MWPIPDLPLPPSYGEGQLVVEYATVCFRSCEDFGPPAKTHANSPTLRLRELSTRCPLPRQEPSQ